MVLPLPASFIPDKNSTAVPKRSDRAKRAAEASSTPAKIETSKQEDDEPVMVAEDKPTIKEENDTPTTTLLPPSPPPPTVESKEEVVALIDEDPKFEEEESSSSSEVVPIRHVEEKEDKTTDAAPSATPTVEVLVSTKTLRELKDMCLALGLSDKGKKADLAQRWMDAK